MGFQHKNICYPTLPAAKQAACTSATQTWGNGASVMTADCTTGNFTSTSSVYVVRRCTNGTACVSANTFYPAFQACTFDGSNNNPIEYFSMFLAVFVIVIAAKTVLNIFRGRHEVA